MYNTNFHRYFDQKHNNNGILISSFFQTKNKIVNENSRLNSCDDINK